MQGLELPQNEVLGLLADFERLLFDFETSLDLLLHELICSGLHELSYFVAKDASAQSELFSEHYVKEIEQEDR
jgi:hypothetical protein